MQTPIDLIGYPISMMSNNQVVQTTTFTQAIQPTSPTLQMWSYSIPFIRGQSSTRGQYSAGGKPFARGKPSTMRQTPI